MTLDRLTSGLWPRTPAGNGALSPRSVAGLLALAARYAAGETRAELEALVEDLPPLVGVRGAQRLYGQRGVRWLTDVAEADFAADPDRARRDINAWVSGETDAMIPELLPAGLLDRDTRLVLVDALLLKADWATPFPPHATRPAPFRVPTGTVEVPTMRVGVDDAGLARGDGWTALRLPYAGGETAMTVLLPDEDAPDAVDAAIAAGRLDELLAAPTRTRVDVALPRFTVRREVELTADLRALGVDAAFDPARADFSGLTTEERLFLSAVVHQAVVEVDEEGTRAAAATAGVMTRTAIIRRERVEVDRPFVFVVHDLERRTPLFVGRVADPR